MEQVKWIKKCKRPPKIYNAASLQDAYDKHYFEGSMTRYELMDRITKHNPQLRWHANKTHRGLFDSEVGRYICGIGHNMTIPKHTIAKYDPGFDKELPQLDADGKWISTYVHTDDDEGVILTRGWLVTFHIVDGKKYKVDWTGISR